MRINDAYEHDPLLDVCAAGVGAGGACGKISTQCVDVSVPLVLTPVATVGSVTVTCQGNPTISCAPEDCGANCTIIVTQQLCISVPLTYDVDLKEGEVCITCADAVPGAPCVCRK